MYKNYRELGVILGHQAVRVVCGEVYYTVSLFGGIHYWRFHCIIEVSSGHNVVLQSQTLCFILCTRVMSVPANGRVTLGLLHQTTQ